MKPQEISVAMGKVIGLFSREDVEKYFKDNGVEPLILKNVVQSLFVIADKMKWTDRS